MPPGTVSPAVSPPERAVAVSAIRLMQGVVYQESDAWDNLVVKKLQMARCGELIRERLNAAGERSDGARVDAGMSARSKGGIVQHFIEYKSGRVTRKIGWQLEERQLRLVGILGDKEWRRIDPDQRGQILEEENEG